MHRFFISPDRIEDGTVTLPTNVAHQLTRVLRRQPGDGIVVLDGTGWEYDVTLTTVGSREALGSVTDGRIAAGEPRTAIILYQALLKADRFELVLQKGTELGVSRFVPVVCTRSVAKESPGGSRTARRRKIIVEAAEQSRRGVIPGLDEPVSFVAACDAMEGPAVIPWEEEEATGLRTVLSRWKAEGLGARLSLLVGPEGGFTAEEVAHARSRGIEPVTLGSRILRAETASIAAVSATLYELGDLGG